jgi:hypothetical protein
VAHPSSNNSSLIASPLSPTSGWVAPSLYVDTATGAFEPAGFVTSEDSTASTQTSFTIFGHLLYYKSPSGLIKTQFYATPTKEDPDVYVLKWNSDNIVEDGSVVVAIKNIP